MRRPHSFFSPLGLVLSALLLVGLALSMLNSGGRAFSPGRLTAISRSAKGAGGFTSHAEFESECKRCHQPGKAAQSELCKECHQGVAGEIASRTGVHGRILTGQACASCHPDHRGREFDSALAALQFFDHSAARFSLVWHQLNYAMTPLACDACHSKVSPDFAVIGESCASCHGAHDPAFIAVHREDYGEDCLACHDGLDSLARFDHAATQFPLDGKHAGMNCADCHTLQIAGEGQSAALQPATQRFSGLKMDCQSCHAEPQEHQGLFGRDCAACHTAAGWLPANMEGAAFDHAVTTGFSLDMHAVDYQSQPIACAGCHTARLAALDINTCIECHAGHDPAFMQGHLTEAGPACMECHDGTDRLSGFDHAAVFPLDGKHAGLACRDCHVQGMFAETGSECVQCHSEPPIHAGVFGLECQNCHGSEAWTPALLQEHAFPLDHGEDGPVACQTCHPTSYIEYTCYGCHEHQPAEINEEHLDEGISMSDLPNCTECHANGQEPEDD